MGKGKGLSLYRSILKAHRKLPNEMRKIGDSYVRNEFKMHKKAEEKHLSGFFSEWETYLEQLKMTTRAKEAAITGSLDRDDPSASVFQFGRDLPQDAQLSDEQKQQLEKLKEEISKASGI